MKPEPALARHRMVNSRGEFTGAHNPAVPHWSQIQHLAIRMMPLVRDVAACVRAACPSHVARQSSSTTFGFMPRTSMCALGRLDFSGTRY
jgi:hypothetical protein